MTTNTRLYSQSIHRIHKNHKHKDIALLSSISFHKQVHIQAKFNIQSRDIATQHVIHILRIPIPLYLDCYVNIISNLFNYKYYLNIKIYNFFIY